MATAQRIARAGPSKVARKPSPAVSISRPRNRSSSRRTAERWRSSRFAQLRSPSARTRSVDPTMSVNKTVASTRFGCGAGLAPVTSSSISSKDHVSILGPPGVIYAQELDKACAGNARGDVAALLDVRVAILRPVHDDRRNANRRQYLPHVDMGVHLLQGHRRARAGTTAIVTGEFGQVGRIEA